MSEKFYSIEAVVAILGVDEDQIASLINQGLVETSEQDGVTGFTGKILTKLFDMDLSDDPASTDVSVPSKNERSNEKSKERSKKKWKSKGYIVVDQEELTEIHEERRLYRDRANSLISKAKRIEQKVNEYKAMELGLNAKFWKMAKALYPALWADSNFICEETKDGSLVIKEDKSESGDFKKDFRDIIARGMREGHLPPPQPGGGQAPPQMFLDMDEFKDDDDDDDDDDE